MNICVLTSLSDFNAGGIANHALSIARCLSGQGHRFTIITRGNTHNRIECEIDGIRVFGVRFLPAYPFHVSVHSLFVNRLIKSFEDEYDLIHAHSPLIPVPDSSLPIMTTVHTPMKSEAKFLKGFQPHTLASRMQIKLVTGIEKKLFLRSKRIAVVANTVKDELAAYSVPGENIDWIGTGVDHIKFSPDYQSVDTTDPYILFSGRLLERKGLLALLKAATMVCREVPRVKFILLGNGPLKKHLTSEAERLGIGRQLSLCNRLSMKGYRQHYWKPCHAASPLLPHL